MSSDKQVKNNQLTRLPFYKSIRFKFTILYSTITFVVSALFILGLNLAVNRYFTQQTQHMMQNPRPRYSAMVIDSAELSYFEELRMQDIDNMQRASLIALLPIATGSFLLGYILSGTFTKPLDKLRKKVSSMTDETLGLQVKVESDDEIGLLAKTFNEMSLRLKDAFDIQSRFVQDATHELKTPLAIIQANAQDALDNTTATKMELNESLNAVVKGIKRMARLTDALLDLTRPFKLTFKKTNLSTLIKDQVELLRPFAKDKKVKIKTKLDKDVFAKIDSMYLGQAIFNLLDNAVKYSALNEKKKPEVTILLTQEKRNVRIDVVDNGIGIPKDKLNHIFDRFYRVDKGRSRKAGGFGLGLSIVKRIIDKHNGEITVESDNTGSTFSILLP